MGVQFRLVFLPYTLQIIFYPLEKNIEVTWLRFCCAKKKND